jgi:hypothetical protein
MASQAPEGVVDPEVTAEAEPKAEKAPVAKAGEANAPAGQDELETLRAELEQLRSKTTTLEEENGFYRDEADRLFEEKRGRERAERTPAPRSEPQRDERRGVVEDDPFAVSDEEIDMLGKDAKRVLPSLLRRAAETGARMALGTLSHLSAQQQQAADIHTAFYSEHRDLAEYPEVVGIVAGRVQRQYPRVEYRKLFPRIASEAKKELERIRKGGAPAETKEEPARRKPAGFSPGAKTGGAPKAEPDLSDQDEAMSELAPEFFGKGRR